MTGPMAPLSVSHAREESITTAKRGHPLNLHCITTASRPAPINYFCSFSFTSQSTFCMPSFLYNNFLLYTLSNINQQYDVNILRACEYQF